MDASRWYSLLSLFASREHNQHIFLKTSKFMQNTIAPMSKIASNLFWLTYFRRFPFADGKSVPSEIEIIEKCTIEDAIKQTGEHG